MTCSSIARLAPAKIAVTMTHDPLDARSIPRIKGTNKRDRFISSDVEPIFRECKGVSLLAAMSEMPDMAGQEMAVGNQHRFAPLKRAICYRKSASKR